MPNRRPPRTDFSRTDWRRSGVGRIAVTVNATGREDLDTYHQLLTKLHVAGRGRLLDAIRRGDVSLVAVRRAYEAGGMFGLIGFEDETRLSANLWTTLQAAANRLGASEQTRRRYRASAQKLSLLGGLGPRAAVRDLRKIDWRELRGRWVARERATATNAAPSHRASAADWNALGRFISSALTELFGGKRLGRRHPFRQEVMDAFPFEREHPRKVTITLLEFQRLVAALPPRMRPPIVTLAVTGIRLGEYLGLTEASLEPGLPGLRVTGKTGPGVVPVDEALWPVVRSAVPAPCGEKALRSALERAAASVGHPTLRLHDLRHLAAHAAIGSGASLAEVQQLLRHADPAQTMDYLAGASAAAASRALAKAFAPTIQIVNGGPQ